MAAFLIVYDTVTDPARFQKYAQTVEPVIERRGGRMVAAGSPDVVEGAFPWERAVVFEWPSRADALGFWNSDEYAEIRKLREGAAEFQAVILEGIHLPGR